MTTYFLPHWVHLCFAHDGAVFLDIRRDRYVGLDSARARLLRRLMEGGDTPELDEFARDLAAAGLLTTICDDNSRSLTTPSLAPPDRLLAETFDERSAVAPAHLAAFLMSCAVVWLSLHLRSFEHALQRLTARKRRVAQRAPLRSRANLKEAVQAFVYLRTFVYTAYDHCLFDSLVLCDFLLRLGLSPTCVFGVRTLPFGAHCWVQVDRSLLTESSIEYVATFSPVLVI